jgi:putative chitinase
MRIDRTVFFDLVRSLVFNDSLSQEQVDGMEAILAVWESDPCSDDLRWLAYPLATTKWETASTMQPIEEYGRGAGYTYGQPDPETGQTYYGRGYVQLTWRDNYARADHELALVGSYSCEKHAENALHPDIAASILFEGMVEGWFRSGQTLERYFNADTDDPVGAREIINGDKDKVPDWGGGQTTGDLIAKDHAGFLRALEVACIPDEEVELAIPILVTITIPAGVRVDVQVDVVPADEAEA